MKNRQSSVFFDTLTKMFKTLVTNRNVRYFIRETVIVMTGVTVTLIFTFFIRNIDSTSQAKQTLELVKGELQDNLEQMDSVLVCIETHKKSFEKIKAHLDSLELIDRDSIIDWMSSIMDIYDYKSTYHALDVVKQNAASEKIKNEVIFEINSAYGKCKEFDEMIKEYTDDQEGMVKDYVYPFLFIRNAELDLCELTDILIRDSKIFQMRLNWMYFDLVQENCFRVHDELKNNIETLNKHIDE